MIIGAQPITKDIRVLTEKIEKLSSDSELLLIGRIFTEQRVFMNLKNKVSLFL